MAFISSHILILVLLFAGLMTFLWLLLFRERLHMTWWAALIISVLHVFYGVFCVKFFAILEGSDAGSMSIYGAVFFMPVGYFLAAKLFKRRVADVFDIFAVPMIFTLLCARVNCLVSGCCYGLHIGDSPFRWPTRESEMLFYVILLLIVAPKVKKGGMDGRLYPIYMIAYGIFRGINECFRYSALTDSHFHLSHIWCIVSVLIGTAILLYMNQQKKKQPVPVAAAEEAPVDPAPSDTPPEQEE